MKFELELTEEELREIVEHHSWVPSKIQDQIRAQLPKEKSWEEKYKFLVGYAEFGLAKCGWLNAITHKYDANNVRVYAFSKAQFVRAVNILYNGFHRTNHFSFEKTAEEFLEKQEAE